MSHGLIEKDIEANATLIADGKEHRLRHLSVTSGESVQSLRMTVEPINPLSATAKKLILMIPDMGIRMTVLRAECKGSLVPADEHFHLIVPDQNDLEKIAKLLLPDAPHPA